MRSTRNAKQDVADSIGFLDLEPTEESFREAVIQGLGAPRKSIPCKFLYDSHGSALFEAICDLPEYYPTRTEMALLARHAGDIAALIGRDCQLIEFGSGASRKVRLLLDALERPAAYLPVDIAREPLLRAAAEVARDYPEIPVTAVCADYGAGMPLPAPPRGGRRVAFFPGSTIGNLRRPEAQGFLSSCAALLRNGGALVVGVDLKKDPATLNAAYNDSQGITASFSLNLLSRINRELDGDFDLDGFRHLAFYNEEAGRIEIYLESLRAQTVHVTGVAVELAAGERIHIEDSCKYTVPEFQALAQAAGFVPQAAWTDPQALFSVHYLRSP